MQQEVLKEKLIFDVKEVVSDSEDLLKVTAADASEKTSELRAKMTERLAKAKEQLKDIRAEFSDRTTAAAEKTDLAIRKNPYQSIGLALGLGLLVGVALNRR